LRLPPRLVRPASFMTGGALLTVVAMVLALVIAGLFRLVAVVDSTELALRRLAGEVRAARKTMATASELATAVERHAASGQAGLHRLEELKKGRPAPPS
ncbi:MAG: hypothetical protein LC792_10455, partial [Actinobacteria bacterium]|nr:hypothetical protein [Actinomycetota bacterium]